MEKELVLIIVVGIGIVIYILGILILNIIRERSKIINKINNEVVTKDCSNCAEKGKYYTDICHYCDNLSNWKIKK